MANIVKLLFLIILISLSGCETEKVNEPYFKKYIGKTFSEIFLDDSLSFQKYEFINEPPGIGRGIICTSKKGQQVYIYFGRKDATLNIDGDWKLDDFNNKIISGIAINRNNKWQTFGSVIKYYHQ